MGLSAQTMWPLLLMTGLTACIVWGGCLAGFPESESSQTEIRPYPSERLVRFHISGTGSAAELMAALQEILGSLRYKGAKFTCHRYGPDDRHLGCLLVKGNDIFDTRHESASDAVTLSLIIRPPANLDRSYRPDYKLFDALGRELRAKLSHRFGADNVRVGD